MTDDMTPGTEAKMPERISATLNYSPVGPVLQGTLTVEPSEAAEQVKYIRADVALAMVAEAYGDAAAVEMGFDDGISADYHRYSEAQTRNLIRRRTPADALAALEAVKEEARREAFQQAANAAFDLIMAAADKHRGDVADMLEDLADDALEIAADRADTQEGER